jgi:ELWxxDGT repeat protein
MHITLYILLLTIGSAAYSQPVMLSNVADGSKNFVTVNGRLYYSSSDSLFTATVTSAPMFVYKTGEPIQKIYNIAMGTNFFFVTQSAAGQKLWRTDGTSANTAMLTTQTQITPLLVYHSELFMRVNSSGTGVELWKVDAANNVSIVKDVNPGSGTGFVGNLAIYNDLLYFIGNNGSASDLWKSDGTTAGTLVTVDLDDTELINVSPWHGLTTAGNAMYFTRNYEMNEWGDRTAELWKTDGTAEGTTVVKVFAGGYFYNYMTNFLAWNGKLYFFHNIGDPAYHYFSVSDGTEAGTTHLALASIDGSPRVILDAGAHILYYAESQSFTSPIEKWDGATSTQVHEFSVYHSTANDELIDLTYADGRAFFLDDASGYYGGSYQLWQADLASGATRTVQEIHGVSLHGSGNITAIDGSIYFTRTVSGQMSLWYYDPDAPPSPCAGNGMIEREEWANVTGYGVSTIPVNTDPSSVTTLNEFSTPRNKGDNYGARVRGYVCVPQNGNYVFYISSDDNSELWLSTDDNPANKRLIASSKWTSYNQWDKYATQQSAEIPLMTGRRYYIEALHKEAAGADHLSVGWRLPNGTLERPMPGLRLVPFQRTTQPIVNMTKPVDGATFVAPATIDIAADANDNDGHISFVSFYSSGTYLGEDYSAPYTFQWQNVPPGNYTIEARAIDNDGNKKSAFRSITVTAPSCTGTGNIFQEIWVNAIGTDVRTFDFSTQPNGGGRYFSSFETTQYYANNYASRMKGYVCVPQSGNYTFWISSDDYSELYLSTDDTEANKKLIAWVYGHTPYRNYDKYPSQKSVQINLYAGKRYYIEARHKEGNGNDFVSVGWQLPDGAMERPIPGNRLISIIPPPNQPPAITITSPQPNQNFPSSPASVLIAANVTDPDGVKEVAFDVLYGSTSTRLATFTSAPYQYQWNNVPSGSYQLIVSASDNRNSGTSKILFFSVENTPCTGAGTIVREIWTGIPGTSVSAIPVDSPPNTTVQLTSFSTPNYYGNDYGSRIRGYVCAPASGVYTFWISGDDNSELWLSDNDDPSNKRRIAYVTGATRVNEWGKYMSQESELINLVQGQRYYIEVLHKEANGADHVEVGWQIPSGVLERPIAGNRLIPFENASTSAAAFLTDHEYSSEETDGNISIYPNPVISGKQFSISLPGTSTGEVHVDIVSVTGVSVQNEKLVSTDEGVVIDLKSSIAPGIYLIKVAGDKKRWRNKVQVK